MTTEQTFRITWRDPETGQMEECTQAFSGDAQIPPREWAEDYAYALADKGHYTITEVKP